MYEAELPVDHSDGEEEVASRTRILAGSMKRSVSEGLSVLRRRGARNRLADEDNSIEMNNMGNSSACGADVQDSRVRVDDPAITSSASTTSGNPMSPTLISLLTKRIRKAHKSAAKAAHKDMLAVTGENGFIEPRGDAWSAMGGIMNSRFDHPIQKGALSSECSGTPRSGGRSANTQSLENNNYAKKIHNDLDEYPPRRPPEIDAIAAPSKRWQNWRRRDVTRYD